MTMGLTRRENELLDLLIARSREGRVVLTCREMADKMGLKSASGIHRLLSALTDRGYIRRLYGRARAIEVLTTPTLPCPHCHNPSGSAACRAAASRQTIFASSKPLQHTFHQAQGKAA